MCQSSFLLTLHIKRQYAQTGHNKSHLNLLHAFDEGTTCSSSYLDYPHLL